MDAYHHHQLYHTNCSVENDTLLYHSNYIVENYTILYHVVYSVLRTATARFYVHHFSAIRICVHLDLYVPSPPHMFNDITTDYTDIQGEGERGGNVQANREQDPWNLQWTAHYVLSAKLYLYT